MRKWVLLVDIGNSRTALAVAPARRGSPARPVLLPTRGTTVSAADAVVRKLAAGKPLAAVVAASVVPRANRTWSRAVRNAAAVPLQWIDCDRPWNFVLRYPRPETLGSDRLVNICGAMLRYRPPLLVLDFGTALTVDMVNGRGEYIGGSIAPGFGMLVGGMSQHTALLPSPALRIGRMPACAAGTSTRAAVRSGVLLGYRGMVRELINTAAGSLAAAVTVVATGGYAVPMMAALPEIACHIHPRLTLEGLVTAYRLAEYGKIDT